MCWISLHLTIKRAASRPRPPLLVTDAVKRKPFPMAQSPKLFHFLSLLQPTTLRVVNNHQHPASIPPFKASNCMRLTPVASRTTDASRASICKCYLIYNSRAGYAIKPGHSLATHSHSRINPPFKFTNFPTVQKFYRARYKFCRRVH